ncbi:unnamed protein product, partial [Meganyctiphanes norvegica]
MPLLDRIKQVFTEGSSEERLPIMTPVEKSGNQSGVGDPGTVDDIKMPTRTGIIQVDPLPVSSLRSDGGYLGPEALNQISRQQSVPLPGIPSSDPPSSRPVSSHAALNGQNPPKPPPVSMSMDRPPSTLILPILAKFEAICSSFEQRLLIVTGALAAVITGILISIAVLVESGPTSVCTTRECILAADENLASRGRESGGQPDFTFSQCTHKHTLRGDILRWSGFFRVIKAFVSAVVNLQGNTLAGQHSTHDIWEWLWIYEEISRLVRNPAWNKAGLTPLLNLLNDLGGLPMLNHSWAKDDFNWYKMAGRLRREFGGQYLIDTVVAIDGMNASRNIIYLDQGSLPVKRAYLIPEDAKKKKLHTDSMKKACRYIQKSMGKYNSTSLKESMYNDIDELWDFYVSLAQITTADVNRTDAWRSYNLMNISQLQEMTSDVAQLNWTAYLSEVFLDTGYHITAETEVIVEELQYFKDLVKLLENTPPNVIANYILYDIVDAMGEEAAPTSLNEFPENSHRTGIKRFFKPTLPIGRENSRVWDDCVGKSLILMDMAVGSLYIRNKFSQEEVEKVSTMVKDVRAGFQQLLETTEWMDSKTMESAKQKMNEMNSLVAFPHMLLSNQELDEYYIGLPKVYQTDHFHNMVVLSTWHANRSLSRILENTTRTRWPRGPAEINAFYSPLQNAIVLPAAILQAPFYRPNTLISLNYGAMGAVIGHEVTHGFDTKGRQRDWQGSLNHWWTNETMAQYETRATCFEKQYSSFHLTELDQLSDDGMPSPSMNISGNQTTKAENIADNGGIRAAWLAFQSRMSQQPEDNRLPGLEKYSHDELFFISYAKLWCSRYSMHALQYELLVGTHSPSHYRILGTLQNNEVFAKVFQCPANSPMNPNKKCVLW